MLESKTSIYAHVKNVNTYSILHSSRDVLTSQKVACCVVGIILVGITHMKRESIDFLP